MQYAAIIQYIEDQEKIEAVRPTHREYLGKLLAEGKLFASGPFADGFGALIVYEADSAEAAEELLTADPFHENGIFVRWSLRPWKVVFANPDLMPKS